MKTVFIAGLVLALFTSPTWAQSLTSGSTSGSSSGATASSSPHQAQQANAQAVYAPTINDPAAPANTSERIKNTPDIVAGAYAPSMSSDSCMTTTQAGASVAGIGITAGHGSADESCRVLRAAEKHLQIMNGAHVIGRDDVALYQLEQAETDGCIADGYTRAQCQQVAHDSVYPPKQ
jgi:hypothetical protein